MKGNPYVGPRPYERADRKNFFGRNREARDLLSLILAERVVLFYAPSGAGKTSLLNAEVIPALEEELFNVLPVVRVANDLAPGLTDADVDNVFVFSVLLSLIGEDEPAAPLGEQSLLDFLQTYLPDDDRPPLLIVDQFEELFTAHRHRWQDAEGFFVQVQEALEALPTLGVVFAMREDYVAEVEPYAPLLPRRLRARFRMERLGVEGAMQAVCNPAAQAGVPFDEGVAEHLVDDLRRSKVQRYGRDDEVEVLGRFVEPVQLQVVCQRLWANLPEQDDNLIQWDEVQQYGDIDRALVDFYESAIAHVVAETEVPERRVRRWTAEHLITSVGTRGLAMRGPEETGGLPNAAVDVLDARHLIRSDLRAGARWYELVHDRLIDPIRQSNRKWEAARQTPLRATAKRWKETDDAALLYLDATLEEALAWAEAHPDELEPYEEAFLDASRQADQTRRRARRLRLAGAVIAGMVLVVVSLLAWVAMRNGLQAYSRELAAKARSALETDREQSIRLARAGTQPSIQGWWRESSQSLVGEINTYEARIMLRQAVQDYYPLSVYENLADQAHSVVYDKTGRFLYAALPGSGVQRFDTRMNVKTLISLPTRGAVYDLALNPDGRFLATGGDDGETGGIVEIWDTEAEAWVESLRVVTPEGMYDEIYAVAFSPQGHYLATGGDYGEVLRDFSFDQDGLIRVWSLGRRGETLVPELLLTLDEPAGRVADLAFTGTASPIEAMVTGEPLTLAAASYDGTVWLWEMRALGPSLLSVSPPRKLMAHTEAVEAVAFSPTEPLLASASADKTIRLWDLDTGEALLTLVGHSAEVRTLAFSADGRYLLSGSRDRTVHLWDVGSRNQHAISVLRGPGNVVLDVVFSPDDRWVAAGAGDNTVRIWDRDFLRQAGLSTLTGHSDLVRKVTYSPDGTFLASASSNGEVRIWSQVHGNVVRAIEGYLGGGLWDLVYSPGGAYLVSCATDNKARVWDTGTGALIATLTGHGADVERAFFTPDGRFLLTVSNDGQALVWRTEDWTLDHRVTIPRGGLWGGTLSPQGDRMALGYLGGTIHLFDVRETERGLSVTMGVTLTGHSNYVPALDFSPDGRYLASGAWDQTARLWSMETMTTVVAPLEHPAFVYDVAFSPDGQYLATAARDSHVRLWKLDRFPSRPPTLMAVLPGHTDPIVYTLAFSPDGHYLASGSRDGTIRRYLVRFEDVLDLSLQYVESELDLDVEGFAEEGNYE